METSHSSTISNRDKVKSDTTSKMIAKLFIVAAVIAAAYGQAAKYPAGVNPSLCPNYPHCDNALLAAYGQHGAGSYPTYPAATAYAGHGVYGHGYFSGNPAAYAAPGYPAGVNPASCPNYPYCTNGILAHHAAAPLPGFSARLYPDGVNPATCPNYPYCH